MWIAKCWMAAVIVVAMEFAPAIGQVYAPQYATPVPSPAAESTKVPPVNFLELSYAEFADVNSQLSRSADIELSKFVPRIRVLDAAQLQQMDAALSRVATKKLYVVNVNSDSKEYKIIRQRGHEQAATDGRKIHEYVNAGKFTIEKRPAIDTEKRSLELTVRPSDDKGEQFDVSFCVPSDSGSQAVAAVAAIRQQDDSVWLISYGFGKLRDVRRKPAPRRPVQNESGTTESNATAPYDAEKQYVISTIVAELNAEAYRLLQDEYGFESQDHGAMTTVSRQHAQQAPLFLGEQAKLKHGRILSRPQLRTVAGQPCSMTVGAEIAVVAPDDDGAAVSKLKPVGLELSLKVRQLSKGRHFFEWQLTNSSAVATDTAQGVRSRHGFDGASTIADDDAVIVACPSGDPLHPWLVAIMDPVLIEESGTVAKKDESGPETLPSPYALTDEIQFFPPGPEFRLDQQVGSLQGFAAKQSGANDSNNSSVEISQGNTLTITDQCRTLHGFAREKWILKCPSSVSGVTGFDKSIVKVESQRESSEQLRVVLMRNGTTTILIDLDDGRRLEVTAQVELADAGLSQYLRRLYPEQRIDVYRVNDSVLLRGKVRDIYQQQQLLRIAESFFPSVLNQLKVTTTGSDAPDLVRSDDGRRFGRVNASAGMNDTVGPDSMVRVEEDRTSLILTVNKEYTLVFPGRIVRCEGLDDEAVRVTTDSTSSNQLTVSAETGFSRVIVHTVTSVYTVEIYAEADVTRLTELTRKLYPHAALSFVPIHGSVLLRGNVNSSREYQEIESIAEQFFPVVLNHLSLATASTESISVPSEQATTGHVSTPPAFQPIPNRKLPRPPQSGTQAAKSQDQEINAMRAEIRALHKDVRDLIQILKERKQPGAALKKEDSKHTLGAPQVGRTLFYFHADYCAPCQKMNPIVDTLATKLPSGLIQKVDITEHPELARRYRIDRIPTVLLVVDGQPLLRESGIQVESRLQSMIDHGASTAGADPWNQIEPVSRPDDISATDESVRLATREGVWLVPVCGSDDQSTVFMNELARVVAERRDVSLSEVVAVQSDLAKSYGVKSGPTLLLMKDGELVDRLVGPATRKQLERFIHNCDSYLSRSAVSFHEDSVVAIRRMNSDGVETHPLDTDVGVVIASEPGRSIIAVPASVLPADTDSERMLVYIYPGSERETRVAADVKWDPASAFNGDAESQGATDIASIRSQMFALLEVEFAEQLPVCRPARTANKWWVDDETGETATGTAPWSVADGQSFAVFRPRSVRSSKLVANHSDSGQQSTWLSRVFRNRSENWDETQTQYCFKADFTGAVIAIDSTGRFLGFGSAIPQTGFITVSSSKRGRSKITLANSMEFFLVSYFGSAGLTESHIGTDDPLVLTAIDADVVKAVRDFIRRNSSAAKAE